MPYKEKDMRTDAVRKSREKHYLRQVAIVIYKSEENVDEALTDAIYGLRTTRPEYVRHALFEKLERDGFLKKPSE